MALETKPLESSLGLSPWGQRDPGDEGGIGQSTQCQREATGLFKPCKNSIPQFWSPWLRCKQRKQMLLKYLWPASTPFDSRVSPVASSLLLSEANAITESRNLVKPTSNVCILAVRSVRCHAFEAMIWLTARGHINLNCPWRTAMCTCSRKDHCRVTNQFPWLPANCLTVCLSLYPPFSLTSNQERPLYESFSIIHSHREEPLSLHIPATPRDPKMP